MGSRGPEVVDGLLTVFTAAVSTPEMVCDGPKPSGATEWLYVGYDANPQTDVDAITSTREQAVQGQSVYDELVQVTCSIVVNGDTPKIVRDAAYALFATANDAIDANQSLGLSGISAYIPSHRYQCLPSKQVGFQGWLVFLVEAEAL